MKKIISIILVCFVFTTLVGCGNQNEAVNDAVQPLVDAFHDADMETINSLIFDANELEIDKELSDMWEDTSKTQEGILEHIFARVTLKVKNITDDAIELEVEAPDMSDVFASLRADADSITEDELLQHITNYAKNAGIKKTVVSLEYILIEKEAVVEYQNEAFINAVIGGLLEAYKSLYTEMMEEYAKGGD